MLKKRLFASVFFSALTISLIFSACGFELDAARAEGTSAVGIIGPSPQIPLGRSPNVNYQINLFREYYFLYKPENHTTSQPFGLLVYIPPVPVMTDLPKGWAEILARHRMLCLIPQRAGNEVKNPRRTGLAILGALAIMQKYRIDVNKVFVGGFSGGARTAGDAAYFQSDLFKGTLQNCGSDFYKAVPHRLGTSWVDTEGHSYGVLGQATPQEVANARSRVRFALITGPDDFRHGNILDIYNGGYAAERFQSRLFDVPGMGHDHCSAETLDKALYYLEGR